MVKDMVKEHSLTLMDTSILGIGIKDILGPEHGTT